MITRAVGLELKKVYDTIGDAVEFVDRKREMDVQQGFGHAAVEESSEILYRLAILMSLASKLEPATVFPLELIGRGVAVSVAVGQED